jgi:hypothetical protein
MSYHRKPRSLGALGTDLAALTKNVIEGVSTAVDVTSDPYLPEAICRAQQLVAIENKRPVPVCTTTRDGLVGGIGLRRVMPVVRGFVYAEQHPWTYPVAGAVVIGIPVLIGYLIGKGLKR